MARKMVIGMCRLCLSENIELINSHVFPRYLWDQMYDKDGKFLIASFEQGTIKKNTNPNLQNGFKEPLMCRDCDCNIIGKYDTYGKRVLEEKFQVLVELGLHKVEGVDYLKFKLFLLSILWRCGVTTSEAFSVNLGPHQEIIRNMLLEGNPGNVEQYGIWGYGIKGDSGLTIDFIHNGSDIRLHGYRCHRLAFGGFLWVYFVSKHRPEILMQKLFPQTDNTMLIQTRELGRINYLMEAAENSGIFKI